MKNVVMFGHSHFLGDLFDIILASGHKLSKVVLNCEEKLVPGRLSLELRLARLPDPVETLNIDRFQPKRDRSELYVIGFSGKKMEPLLTELRKYGLEYETLIHPSSHIQYGAHLGEGVVLDARSIVGPWAELGRHVILNRGASVGHDAVVGDYSFIGPGAVLAGHVRLGQDVFVGAGAVVIPDITVGDGTVIAAGAVVTKNVGPRIMVAGVPAEAKKLLT